jgi:hypothetical protein
MKKEQACVAGSLGCRAKKNTEPFAIDKNSHKV